MQEDNNKITLLGRFSRTLDSGLKNLSRTGRIRKQLLAAIIDGSIALVALWLTYSLRHGEPFSDFRATWHLFFLIPFITVSVFSALGIYRWVIRSANDRLFYQLVKGCMLSSIAMIIVMFFFPPERSNPRSLFVIFGLLLFVSTHGVRVLWRNLFQSARRGEPLAIYGAGNSGQRLVSLLRLGDEYNPVVFIDDDPGVERSYVMGLPVLDGSRPELESRLGRYEVSRIVLAMPSLSGSAYQTKLEQLKQFGMPVQTMPGISEMMDRDSHQALIRDISIKDILGRREVMPNVELMSLRVRGKVVLVTGGGGSIGSELCRQISKLKPSKLVILDSSEVNLYQITEELQPVSNAQNFDFEPMLGSVLDLDLVNRLMSDHEVQTVFHAAAYKHVPIVERQPEQGARVNVFGTRNVLSAAISHAVADFVLVSTDKAVRPTNAMGASKRVAELVLQARAHEGTATRISMVRFGNVLGSSGSVVPKFKKQILAGGPITLTHPDITRFFMTIPEAAQLVLQASAIAQGGEVFVLDMGEPMRIQELAETMVRLYGRELKQRTGNEDDLEIEYTGLRPGEKMYEELFLSEEYISTEVSKIFSANEGFISEDNLARELVRLEACVKQSNQNEVRRIMLDLALQAHQVGIPSIKENKVKSVANAASVDAKEKSGVVAG